MEEMTPKRVDTRGERVLLFFFLLSLPFSIRKVLLIISPEGKDVFNEYWDISLYASDISFFLLSLFILLEYKKYFLSISWWKELFHVEHIRRIFFIPLPFLFWVALSILWSDSQLLASYSFFRLLEGYILYLILIFLIVPRETIAENASVSFGQCSTWNILIKKGSSLFHVKQTQLVYQHVLKIVPRGTINRHLQLFLSYCSTWNIWKVIFVSFIISGFLQSVVAILQFLLQSSLGMTFLKESVLSPSGQGVSKIVIAHEVYIRSYGFFPHPNVLAGFLAITILFTISYPLVFRTFLFHVEQKDQKRDNVPRGTLQRLYRWWKKQCSTWNKWRKRKELFHVEQWLIAYRVIVFIQILAFILTFSKSAFFGLTLALAYFLFRMFHVEHTTMQNSGMNIVPRGTWDRVSSWWKRNCSTWNNRGVHSPLLGVLFHVEQYKKSYFLLFMISLFFIMSINWYYFLIQPLKERLFFEREFIAVITSVPLQGIGIGQGVYVMQDFFEGKLLDWQLQPIHNVFQIMVVETGFIGFIAFMYFIVSLWRFSRFFYVVPRGTLRNGAQNCSTWNNFSEPTRHSSQMFHVEQSTNKKNVPRGTNSMDIIRMALSAMIIVLGIISLFDHYLYDIQQGQLLFWCIAGLLVAASLREYN